MPPGDPFLHLGKLTRHRIDAVSCNNGTVCELTPVTRGERRCVACTQHLFVTLGGTGTDFLQPDVTGDTVLDCSLNNASLRLGVCPAANKVVNGYIGILGVRGENLEALEGVKTDLGVRGEALEGVKTDLGVRGEALAALEGVKTLFGVNGAWGMDCVRQLLSECDPEF